MISTIKRYTLSQQVASTDLECALSLQSYIAHCNNWLLSTMNLANPQEADEQFRFWKLEQLRAEIELFELKEKFVQKQAEQQKVSALLQDLANRGLHSVAHVIREAQMRGEQEYLQLIALEGR
ncbi:hypothetical protein MUG87_01655 [Ectobacillus sp. JY-23]|uniref:hypothetical protein n=1 Tax=Ectobacillus sp. JY-23 TaxID=2933872 RepID=UPI001FF2FB94|nr:hypothetical protein [Ectobacillus sp. JY-23]UOY92875.1 hypothetical protein MUG87_01655 [Ectobacillus sp. JY-23]